MAILIFSMPFSFAVNIREVSLKGQDDMEGIVRPSDNVEVSVVITDIVADEINSQRVRYKDQDDSVSTEFTECHAIDQGIACTYSFTETGEKDAHSYNIYAYTDDALLTLADSYSGSYVIDNLEPQVVVFTINPQITSGDNVVATFNIEDYANRDRDTSKCSGIEKLEIYDNTNQNTPIATIENSAPSCTWIGQEEIDISSLEGEISLCPQPWDLTGQSRLDEDMCVDIIIDKQGVDIISTSFKLVDNSGLDITAYKDSPITGEFSVNISGADLDTASVRGDFSSLNQGAALKATCTTTSDTAIKNCKFPPLTISLAESDSGTKEVTITALDNAGNLGTQIINIPLAYDNQGPTVTSLTTGSENNEGKLFARSADNAFTAEIREDGAGLRKDEIKLNTPGRTYTASSCNKEANWICEFNSIPLNIGTLTVSIGTDSKDALGNAFTTNFEKEVMVDNSRSVVNNIKIEQATQKNNIVSIQGRISTGDTLTIKANLSEPSGIKEAVGNFEILGDEYVSEISNPCEKEGNYVICTWTDITVTKPGFFQGELLFTFTDYSGNVVESRKEITVYENVDGTPSEIYHLSFDTSLIQPIDRQTLRFFVSPVYYYTLPFDLNYDGGCGDDVEIVSMELEGDACAQGSTINYNQVGNDYSGFIQLAMNPLSVPEQWTEYDVGVNQPCNIKFRTRCGEKLYTTAEVEAVRVNIPIIETAEIGKEITDEVDNIIDDISDMDKTIGTLNKYLKYGETICGLKGVYGTVTSALAVLGGNMGAVIDTQVAAAASLGTAHATEGTLKVSEISTISSGEGLRPIIDSFCNFITCRGEKTKIPFTDNEVQFGGGFCTSVQDHAKDMWSNIIRDTPDSKFTDSKGAPTLAGALASANAQSFNMDTLDYAKQSWAAAISCRCIPAIIYNLHKKNQIDCQKAVCYRDMIPLGWPKSSCDDRDRYNNCLYWSGQTQGAIAWLTGFDAGLYFLMPIKKILNVLRNPVASGYMYYRTKKAIACAKHCQDPTPSSEVDVDRSISCAWNWGSQCGVYGAMILAEAGLEISNFVKTKDTLFEPEVDYCMMLLDADGDGEEDDQDDGDDSEDEPEEEPEDDE